MIEGPPRRRAASSLSRRLLRQRLRIQQATVTMNCGQAVAEFVRQSCREFAEARQRLLESKLLFQLNHGREVGKEAHRRL